MSDLSAAAIGAAKKRAETRKRLRKLAKAGNEYAKAALKRLQVREAVQAGMNHRHGIKPTKVKLKFLDREV